MLIHDDVVPNTNQEILIHQLYVATKRNDRSAMSRLQRELHEKYGWSGKPVPSSSSLKKVFHDEDEYDDNIDDLAVVIGSEYTID